VSDTTMPPWKSEAGPKKNFQSTMLWKLLLSYDFYFILF